MGLFGKKNKVAGNKNKNRQIKSVTLYYAFGGFLGGMGSVNTSFSMSTIVDHLDQIGEYDPDFAKKVKDFILEYRIDIKALEGIPLIRSQAELDSFVSKKFKSYPKRADCSALTNEEFRYLYYIEYGEPDPIKIINPVDKKDIQAIFFAQYPLKQAYEDYAQKIVAASKAAGDDWKELKESIREIGVQVNDYDTMVLIARRAEKLAKEKNQTSFSIRALEYAWNGIAGWMS